MLVEKFRKMPAPTRRCPSEWAPDTGCVTMIALRARQFRARSGAASSLEGLLTWLSLSTPRYASSAVFSASRAPCSSLDSATVSSVVPAPTRCALLDSVHAAALRSARPSRKRRPPQPRPGAPRRLQPDLSHRLPPFRWLRANAEGDPWKPLDVTQPCIAGPASPANRRRLTAHPARPEPASHDAPPRLRAESSAEVPSQAALEARAQQRQNSRSISRSRTEPIRAGARTTHPSSGRTGSTLHALGTTARRGPAARCPRRPPASPDYRRDARAGCRAGPNHSRPSSACSCPRTRRWHSRVAEPGRLRAKRAIQWATSFERSTGRGRHCGCVATPLMVLDSLTPRSHRTLACARSVRSCSRWHALRSGLRSRALRRSSDSARADGAALDVGRSAFHDGGSARADRSWT